MSSSTPEWVGPYRVLRELGRGGMGLVLEVEQPDTGRRLALKLIVTRPSETALRRFGREAEVLARVEHPHVLRVWSFDHAPQGPYLVTDLVEGDDLERCVKLRGPFPPREAARIVRALADALDAVHRAGIVHRDLKPQNVILRPDGEPVLLDFGLAMDEQGERLTLSGAFLGTPAFMAPEQTGSRSDVGPWTDVYGLGGVLIWLLTGRPPYGDGLPGPIVVKKLLTEDPRWPRADRPEVPEALDEVCRRAMAKDTAGRLRTAAELRAALDAFLAPAGSPPTGHLLGRGRLLLGGLGALLVAAALALRSGGAAAAPTPGAQPGSSPPAAPPTALPGPALPAAWPEHLDRPLAALETAPSARQGMSLVFLAPDLALVQAHPDDVLHVWRLSPAGCRDDPLALGAPAWALRRLGERAILALAAPAGVRLVRVDPRADGPPEPLLEVNLPTAHAPRLAVHPGGALAISGGQGKGQESRCEVRVRRANGAELRIEARGEVSDLAFLDEETLVTAWGYSAGLGGIDSQGGLRRYDLRQDPPRLTHECVLGNGVGGGQALTLLVTPRGLAVGDSAHYLSLVDPAGLELLAGLPAPAEEQLPERAGPFTSVRVSHGGSVRSLALGPEGRLWSLSGESSERDVPLHPGIVLREVGNEVRVWDLDSGEPRGGLRGWRVECGALAVSPDGERVLLGLLPWAQRGARHDPPRAELWQARAFFAAAPRAARLTAR